MTEQQWFKMIPKEHQNSQGVLFLRIEYTIHNGNRYEILQYDRVSYYLAHIQDVNKTCNNIKVIGYCETKNKIMDEFSQIVTNHR